MITNKKYLLDPESFLCHFLTPLSFLPPLHSAPTGLTYVTADCLHFQQFNI